MATANAESRVPPTRVTPATMTVVATAAAARPAETSRFPPVAGPSAVSRSATSGGQPRIAANVAAVPRVAGAPAAPGAASSHLRPTPRAAVAASDLRAASPLAPGPSVAKGTAAATNHPAASNA
jgi:hypothetical protein